MQVEAMQMSQHLNTRPLSLDKELPPAPLLTSPMDTSPMDVDFNMYSDSNEHLLKPPSLQDWQSFSSAHSFSDTQSLSSTIFEEQTMAQQHMAAHQHNGLPLSWEELNHYGGAQHQQG